MTADPETIAVYDARAADYAARFASEGPDGTLRRFIAALPPGGRVLDLGCGPGTASAHMRAAGLDPDPVDASAEMVRHARDVLGLPARIARFEDVTAVEAYDGIWANFALLHAARDDLPGLFVTLGAALRPGGLFHIGMKTGTGARRDTLGRLYSYVTEAELGSWLTAARITVTWRKTGTGTGLAGTPEPFVVLQGRRDA